MITISAFGISFVGCTASFSTSKDNSNAAKPTTTASSPAANKNSSITSIATAEKPKTVLKDEKKPEGTGKTAKKDVPVPADWVYVYDENKGYGFQSPKARLENRELTKALIPSSPKRLRRPKSV